MHAAGSYLSSSDLCLHYGLGKQEKVDLIEIHWPDGKVETVRGIPCNNFLTIEEEKAVTRTIPSGAVRTFSDSSSSRK